MWYKSSWAGIWSARLLPDCSCRFDLITLWSQRDKLMVIMLTPRCVKDAHYSESCVQAATNASNPKWTQSSKIQALMRKWGFFNQRKMIQLPKTSSVEPRRSRCDAYGRSDGGCFPMCVCLHLCCSVLSKRRRSLANSRRSTALCRDGRRSDPKHLARSIYTFWVTSDGELGLS